MNLGQFKNLSVLRQRILEILAIGGTPMSPSTLILLLKACGWASAATKTGVLTQVLVKIELKALIDVGFVSPSNSSMSYVEAVSPVLDAVVQQSVLDGNFKRIVAAIETSVLQLDTDASRSVRTDLKLLFSHRKARIAFYRGDAAAFNAIQQSLESASRSLSSLKLLEPFNAEIFGRTPSDLQACVLVTSASSAILSGGSSVEYMAAYDHFMERQEAIPNSAGDWWVNLLAARGDTKKLQQIANREQPWSRAAAAYFEFLTANYERCETTFDELLTFDLETQTRDIKKNGRGK